MAIPKFQEITLPMLQLASDGDVWSLADARHELAKHFQLTEEELEELLPSGRQARYANRVAWAKVYLERGGLLSSPKRAYFQITERGREVLQNPPEEVSINKARVRSCIVHPRMKSCGHACESLRSSFLRCPGECKKQDVTPPFYNAERRTRASAREQ